MDIVSPQTRSRMMAAVRGKNTSLEKYVFTALGKKGVAFKRHCAGLPGSPDVVLPEAMKAIFIDGDFWHGYRYPAWRRKIKSPFWRRKIETNRLRDRRNMRKLRSLGWRVMRIWGHEIKNEPERTLRKLYEFTSSRPNSRR